MKELQTYNLGASGKIIQMKEFEPSFNKDKKRKKKSKLAAPQELDRDMEFSL